MNAKIEDKARRNVTTIKVENCGKSCGVSPEEDDALVPVVENTVADSECVPLKCHYAKSPKRHLQIALGSTSTSPFLVL